MSEHAEQIITVPPDDFWQTRYQFICACGMSGIAWLAESNAERDLTRHRNRYKARHQAPGTAGGGER